MLGKREMFWKVEIYSWIEFDKAWLDNSQKTVLWVVDEEGMPVFDSGFCRMWETWQDNLACLENLIALSTLLFSIS